MKKAALLSFILALFAFVGAPATQAQTLVQVGPRAGFDFGGDIQLDTNTTFLFGVDARITPEGFPITINPAFDFYFPSTPDGIDRSFFLASANALYKFAPAGGTAVFTPYAGAGLAVAFSSSENEALDIDDSSTEIGINLLAGAEFNTGTVSPFVELGFSPVFADPDNINLIQVRGGLLFNL
jgi:opacity protein-like surface antigen